LDGTNNITIQHNDHDAQQLQQLQIQGGGSGAVSETPRIFTVKVAAVLRSI
jgi:hypothetical protein